jgi:uncharacterized protein YndB with AHSA1/START domain
MTLARSWEAAAGFPDEVRGIFRSSGHPQLMAIEPLLVVPEYQVPLPGGRRASQTDVFVLARSATGLVAIAVEGKVDEAFGPTLMERRSEESEGVETRITFLLQCLGLSEAPGSVRYQLLHRAASAIVAAQQYFASHAVMLVHSFSSSDRWFDDFAAFAKLFNRTARIGELVTLGSCSGVELHIGWCKGDQRFRAQAGTATAGVARDVQSRVDSASRVIKAPPTHIYRAYIDPSALARWLPPKGMTGRIELFDPREGGEYRIVLTYVDADRSAPGKTTREADVVHGRFLELVPDRKIVQSVRFESADPRFAGEMKLTWQLNPVLEGTSVVITAENVPDGITRADHEAGFAATLDNLAAFVEASSAGPGSGDEPD